MHSMIELHPEPGALHGLGLPAIPYPVALPAFQAAVANDGELPLADMLRGLQRRAADATVPWQRLEPAMARLAELLAPDDPAGILTAEGPDWWLEVGPVDLGGDIVTLQRGDALLAAIAPRDDGRLRVAAYRPLDARAIEALLALAHGGRQLPGQKRPHGHWERARDAAASSRPRANAGSLSHLVRWPSGLGIGHGGQDVPEWRALAVLEARRPACVVAEINTFDAAGAARS